MKISKIKATIALFTGGMSGIVKYILNVFNEQILSRIPDKATGLKYLRDIQAISTLLRTIMENHADDLSEPKKEKFNALLAAIDELTSALEDFEVNETELKGIIEKVSDAIDAFKKA